MLVWKNLKSSEDCWLDLADLQEALCDRHVTLRKIFLQTSFGISVMTKGKLRRTSIELATESYVQRLKSPWRSMKTNLTAWGKHIAYLEEPDAYDSRNDTMTTVLLDFMPDEVHTELVNKHETTGAKASSFRSFSHRRGQNHPV